MYYLISYSHRKQYCKANSSWLLLVQLLSLSERSPRSSLSLFFPFHVQILKLRKKRRRRRRRRRKKTRRFSSIRLHLSFLLSFSHSSFPSSSLQAYLILNGSSWFFSHCGKALFFPPSSSFFYSNNQMENVCVSINVDVYLWDLTWNSCSSTTPRYRFWNFLPFSTLLLMRILGRFCRNDTVQ